MQPEEIKEALKTYYEKSKDKIESKSFEQLVAFQSKNRCEHIIVSHQALRYFLDHPKYLEYLDPSDTHQEVLEGKVGYFLGATLYTDSFFEDHIQENICVIATYVFELKD